MLSKNTVVPIDDVDAPRQQSQRQQRALEGTVKNSIDVNFELSSAKKQGTQKQLQPLPHKSSVKTVAISSLKAKDLAQTHSSMQGASINQMHESHLTSHKKKRTQKHKRLNMLEPVSDSKVVLRDLRKTDSNFCLPTSP